MWATLAATAASTFASMAIRLMTAAFFEEVLIWCMRKAAASSKTKVDDELLAKVTAHLEQPKQS